MTKKPSCCFWHSELPLRRIASRVAAEAFASMLGTSRHLRRFARQQGASRANSLQPLRRHVQVVVAERRTRSSQAPRTTKRLGKCDGSSAAVAVDGGRPSRFQCMRVQSQQVELKLQVRRLIVCIHPSVSTGGRLLADRPKVCKQAETSVVLPSSPARVPSRSSRRAGMTPGPVACSRIRGQGSGLPKGFELQASALREGSRRVFAPD